MKKLLSALKKYGAIVKITFMNRLVYTVDILSEIFFLFIMFSILYALHRATALVKSTSVIEVLSLNQTMWILFLTTMMLDERRFSIIKILKEEILSGQIAYQLNKPFSYPLFHFAQSFGARIPTMLFCGLISGIYIFMLVGLPPLSGLSLFIGLFMICIGTIISFLLSFCIGICAFWIGETDPLRWLYLQTMVIAGGLVVPPSMLPTTIKNIILALPFSHITYGAARVMLGCSTPDIIFYLGMQLFWLIMLLVITHFIFNRGVKNVTICGG